MVIRIACVIVLGIIALYQTIVVHVLRDAIDVQRIALDAAGGIIRQKQDLLTAMGSGLTRVMNAMQRGDVAAVLLEMQATIASIHEEKNEP